MSYDFWGFLSNKMLYCNSRYSGRIQMKICVFYCHVLLQSSFLTKNFFAMTAIPEKFTWKLVCSLAMCFYRVLFWQKYSLQWLQFRKKSHENCVLLCQMIFEGSCLAKCFIAMTAIWKISHENWCVPISCAFTEIFSNKNLNCNGYNSGRITWKFVWSPIMCFYRVHF